MNITNYTQEQKDKIKQRLIEAIDKSFEVNKYGKGSIDLETGTFTPLD